MNVGCCEREFEACEEFEGIVSHSFRERSHYVSAYEDEEVEEEAKE